MTPNTEKASNIAKILTFQGIQGQIRHAKEQLDTLDALDAELPPNPHRAQARIRWKQDLVDCEAALNIKKATAV